MDSSELVRKFREFQAGYSEEERDRIWQEHSAQFRAFWAQKIMDSKSPEPTEAEIDQVVRILDTNAKGNTRQDESVARVMTPQGVWRRLFRELRRSAGLHDKLNAIFSEPDEAKRVKLLDELYKANEGHKNNLTGKSASVLGALFVAHSPAEYLSVVSLNDRRKVVEAFHIPKASDFDKDSPGKKIIESNRAIKDWFRSIGITASTRTVSRFLYSPLVKDAWKSDAEPDDTTPQAGPPSAEEGVLDEEGARLFYMESQLEDFLIENWEKTELGKKFDLIEESGQVVSQQYPTDIGKIDILAQDKKTKQLVVIELKKGQTSDDTVGQLTRYMGWLEEHKTGEAPTRGIIIAGEYDRRLHYAIKKIRDVEIYLYRVDFKLAEFKQK